MEGKSDCWMFSPKWDICINSHQAQGTAEKQQQKGSKSQWVSQAGKCWFSGHSLIYEFIAAVVNRTRSSEATFPARIVDELMRLHPKMLGVIGNWWILGSRGSFFSMVVVPCRLSCSCRQNIKVGGAHRRGRGELDLTKFRKLKMKRWLQQHFVFQNGNFFLVDSNSHGKKLTWVSVCSLEVMMTLVKALWHTLQPSSEYN